MESERHTTQGCQPLERHLAALRAARQPVTRVVELLGVLPVKPRQRFLVPSVGHLSQLREHRDVVIDRDPNPSADGAQ